MNASHLKSILKRILRFEDKFDIQSAIDDVDRALHEFVSNKSREAITKVTSSRAHLDNVLQNASAELHPELDRDIQTIHGKRYFNRYLRDEIKSWLSEFASAPSVARDHFHEEAAIRSGFLSGMRNTVGALSSFEIPDDEIAEGQSELEVLIPRALFEGSLQGLQQQLDLLNKIIRAFYELNGLAPDPIDVRHISASDPHLFLGIDVSVLLDIAKAVKWCIDVIKDALGFRKAWAEAKKSAFADSTDMKRMEDSFDKRVDAKIEEKISELAARFKEEHRRNEMRLKANFAVRELLYMVESGGQFIPRALPSQELSEDDDRAQAYRALNDIAKALEYAVPDGEPILKIAHIRKTDTYGD